MDDKTQITVSKLHTDEMVSDEIKSMLGAGEVKLTLGALMSLSVLGSPYIHGGKVTEQALAEAYELVTHKEGMGLLDFHEAFQKEIDTAFRAFEIIEPEVENPTAHKGRKSEIGNFSPEWFADIVAQACHAMPSLTYNQILSDVPLVFVFHLAVSTARSNGCITRRPNDIKEALEQFKKLRREKK